MDVERKVVLADSGIALTGVVLGLLYAEPVTAEFWWVGALATIGTAGATWASEHGVVSDWAGVAAVAVFGVALFAVGLTWGADLVADALVPAGLAGMGAGLLPYRLYYGVVRPVPERRLRSARGDVT